MKGILGAGKAAIISALSGAIVWMGIMVFVAVREGGTIAEAFTGNHEAWDYPLYNWVGVPLLLICAGVVGYLSPRRAWRWGVIPCASQWVVMVAQNPHGNLLPLSFLAFAPYILFFVVAATTGASLSNNSS